MAEIKIALLERMKEQFPDTPATIEIVLNNVNPHMRELVNTALFLLLRRAELVGARQKENEPMLRR